MRVERVCTRVVITIERDAPLLDACKLMRKHHVGDLVVVDPDTDELRPVGMITDRDIVVGVLAKDEGEHLHKLLVEDVMTTRLATAGLDWTVFDAVLRMREAGVRRLPVVDEDQVLVGIVTLDDALQSLTHHLQLLCEVALQQPWDEIVRRP